METMPSEGREQIRDGRILTALGYISLVGGSLPIVHDALLQRGVSLHDLQLHAEIGFGGLIVGAILFAIRDLLQKNLPPRTMG